MLQWLGSSYERANRPRRYPGRAASAVSAAWARATKTSSASSTTNRVSTSTAVSIRRPRMSQLLTRLGRLNATVVFLVTAAFVFAAMALPGVYGGTLLLVLAATVAFLMARTWPVQTPRTRAIRLIILA